MVIDAEKDYERASQAVYIVQALRGGSAGIFTADFRLRLKSNDDAKAEVVDSRLAEIPAHALEPYNKALDFSKRGNAKGAIEQLKKPLIAYPDFMLALNELGVKYLKLGELEKADDALRSAPKIDPEAFEPLMNHDITLVRMERYQDAEPELRQALTRRNLQRARGQTAGGSRTGNLSAPCPKESGRGTDPRTDSKVKRISASYSYGALASFGRTFR